MTILALQEVFLPTDPNHEAIIQRNVEDKILSLIRQLLEMYGRIGPMLNNIDRQQ